MRTKLLFLAFMLFATTGSIYAQPPGSGQRQRATPEERAKTFIEKNAKELKLEGEQKAKLQTTFLEFYKAQEKLMAEMRESKERPDRTVLQKKLATDRDEKAKKFLSEDQMKTLKKIEEAQTMRRGQGGQGGGRQGGSEGQQRRM